MTDIETTATLIQSSTLPGLINPVSVSLSSSSPSSSTLASISSPIWTFFTNNITPPGATASATSFPSPALISNSGRLNTGAIAGIAIGVIVLVLLAGFAIWWLVRRRRVKDGTENGIRYTRPDTHEFMTDTNRHEMITKHNVPEMDGRSRGKWKGVQVLKVENNPNDDTRDRVATGGLATVHELPLEASGNVNANAMEVGAAHELETSAHLSSRREEQIQPAGMLTGNKHMGIGREAEVLSANEEEERKLKLLRDRIDRIREEKERLERIQELRDLEEQTKREILDAQRKQLGS